MTDTATSHRLGLLERRIKLLGLGWIVLLSVIVIVVVHDSRSVPANIRALGFSLVDESGNVLARLARTPDGAVLVLESRTASEKVLVGMLHDSAGLGLVVGDQLRVGLTIENSGSPSLTLSDSGGRVRLMTAVDRADLPLFAMWDEEARLRFSVSPGRATDLQVSSDDGASLLSVSRKKALGFKPTSK